MGVDGAFVLFAIDSMLIDHRFPQVIEIRFDLIFEQERDFVDRALKRSYGDICDNALADNLIDDLSNRIVNGYPPFEKIEHGALMRRAPLEKTNYRDKKRNRWHGQSLKHQNPTR
jgi:hypothetical protein